jgi:LacI family transcriptional regulator
MGYKPDPMVAALMVYRQTKRTPHFQAVLAWINNWPERQALLENPGFQQYHAGATKRAEELGYVVEEFWLHEPGMTPEKMARILKARNVQGLLMAPQPRPYAELAFNFTGFSAIAFGYSMQPAVLNVVANYHFHSINTMISRLVDFGYRRIGLNAISSWNEKVESGMMGGFMLAVHWKYPHLEYIPPHFGHGQEQGSFKAWLESYKPDVVISYDYLEDELLALGYRIPQDIGLASMDVRNKHVSGLSQNSFIIGQKAVDLLVGMIQRGETGIPRLPLCTLIESEWHDGDTLCTQKSPKATRAANPRRIAQIT